MTSAFFVWASAAILLWTSLAAAQDAPPAPPALPEVDENATPTSADDEGVVSEGEDDEGHAGRGDDTATEGEAADPNVSVRLNEPLAPGADEPVTASEALQRAKEAYVEDEYDRVIALMAPWATQERRGLLAPDLQKDVYRLLTLAHLLQTPAKTEEAHMWLGLLLDIDPTFRFVEGMVPPSVLEAQAEVLVKRQNSSDGGAGASDTVYIQKEVRINRRWLTVMPFGVGQFQNGDNGKGGVLATIQIIALSTNMISYYSAESLRSDTGFYSQNNKEIAEGWRVGQFVSLGVLVGFYLYGVIDALIYFEDESIKYRRLLQPPPELTRGPTMPMLEGEGRRLWLGFGEVAPAATTPAPLLEMAVGSTPGSGEFDAGAHWGARSAVVGAAAAPPPVMLLQLGADF